MEEKIATWKDIQYVVNSVMDISFKLGLVLDKSNIPKNEMEEVLSRLKLRTLETLAEDFEHKIL